MARLEDIYRMSQQQLKKHTVKALKKAGYADIQNRDGYVFAEGNVPVLLIAHLDTVHVKPVKDIVYSDKGNRLSSPQGLGGDDRNGVYMILEIIKEIKCHVLFVEDEEIGLIGANKFCDSFKDSLDINYTIEIDRRGFHDAVYYDLDNKEFEQFITESSSGHFKTEYGTCSDISEIAPFLGVAAVNLSSGYYREHTLETYTLLNEVNENIKHIKDIINTKVDVPFEYRESCKFRGWYEDDGWEISYKVNEYAVEFWDRSGAPAVNYVQAVSRHEAIGITVEQIPTIKGEDVIWSGLSEYIDESEVEMIYINGEYT